MSSVNSLWDGFLYMITGLLISVMLMAVLGQIGDKALHIMLNIGEIIEFEPEWAQSFEGVYAMQSLLFILCCLPGMFGVLVFILAAVRRQKYDTVQQQPQIQYYQEYD